MSGKFMKKIIIGLIALSSVSAFASECHITARANGKLLDGRTYLGATAEECLKEALVRRDAFKSSNPEAQVKATYKSDAESFKAKLN